MRWLALLALAACAPTVNLPPETALRLHHPFWLQLADICAHDGRTNPPAWRIEECVCMVEDLQDTITPQAMNTIIVDGVRGDPAAEEQYNLLWGDAFRKCEYVPEL